MLKHHEESLQILKEYFQNTQGVTALILGGSVAKGEARPDSDLDAMVILNDQAFAERKATEPMAECICGTCTYAEGYFDIKYFNKSYLESAVEKGSDPTRNSFVDSKVIFSTDADIEKLISKIIIYPSHTKQERIKTFYSILAINVEYFFGCAIRNNDQYMINKCCFEIVYAGLRMLFAYNEMFFPSHLKLLLYAARLPHKPDGIIELAKSVNEERTFSSVYAFFEAIRNFTDWGIDPDTSGATYVEKFEQTWLFSDANAYEL